jgi:hypothetical protein
MVLRCAKKSFLLLLGQTSYCTFWQRMMLLTQVKPLKSYYVFSLCDDSKFLVLFIQIEGAVSAFPQLLFAAQQITIG